MKQIKNSYGYKSKVGLHLDIWRKKKFKIKKRWEDELDCSWYQTVIVYEHLCSL